MAKFIEVRIRTGHKLTINNKFILWFMPMSGGSKIYFSNSENDSILVLETYEEIKKKLGVE